MFIIAFSVKPKSRHNTNIHWWVNMQNMVYPYSRILFSHEKEWSTNWCSNIDEPWKHYAKWKKSQSQETAYYVIPFI